jgi:hypothetical protein
MGTPHLLLHRAPYVGAPTIAGYLPDMCGPASACADTLIAGDFRASLSIDLSAGRRNRDGTHAASPVPVTLWQQWP